MPRIVVHLDGGIVQDVFVEGEGKEALARLHLYIVDFDTDGGRDEETVVVYKPERGRQVKMRAYVTSGDVAALPDGCDVDLIVKAADAIEASGA